MERWIKAFTQNDEDFKQLFGVKKDVFKKMLAILNADREKRRKKGGPRTKLSTGDQLLLTLQYWREYRTMDHLAYEYGIAQSTVSDTIAQVENVLIKDDLFHLEGKKALMAEGTVERTLAVDVTESQVERPKKNKRNGTPARKKSIRSKLRSWSMSTQKKS